MPGNEAKIKQIKSEQLCYRILQFSYTGTLLRDYRIGIRTGILIEYFREQPTLDQSQRHLMRRNNGGATFQELEAVDVKGKGYKTVVYLDIMGGF